MAKRATLKSDYFPEETPLQFVSTGCTLLDCALGGGFALGRIANIVGDKSTAKTALATEVLINFGRQYPKGMGCYRDIEAAFDRGYAWDMGLKSERVDFGNDDEPIVTVEEFALDFSKFLEARIKDRQPGVYVVDSLDALVAEAEMERELGDSSYGMEKAKLLSTYLPKVARKIRQSNVLLLIISQVRDNIGVRFGEKHRRSGGRALDFYASQILWLSHIEFLIESYKKLKRSYGMIIRAKVKKNKVAVDRRDIDFTFRYSFGIDDVAASRDWLEQIGIEEPAVKETTREAYDQERARLARLVKEKWAEVEEGVKPPFRKYD